MNALHLTDDELKLVSALLLDFYHGESEEMLQAVSHRVTATMGGTAEPLDDVADPLLDKLEAEATARGIKVLPLHEAG